MQICEAQKGGAWFVLDKRELRKTRRSEFKWGARGFLAGLGNVQVALILLHCLDTQKTIYTNTTSIRSRTKLWDIHKKNSSSIYCEVKIYAKYWINWILLTTHWKNVWIVINGILASIIFKLVELKIGLLYRTLFKSFQIYQ